MKINQGMYVFYQFPSTNLKAIEYNAMGRKCLHEVLMTHIHTELLFKKVLNSFLVTIVLKDNFHIQKK